MRSQFVRIAGSVAAMAVVAALPQAVLAQGWEPTKTVEFIIPAGTGGGADQMARAAQGIIAKHGLMKQSILPINKAGGAGAEGFLDVKGAQGDPHKGGGAKGRHHTETGKPNGKQADPRGVVGYSVSGLRHVHCLAWMQEETPAKRAGVRN